LIKRIKISFWKLLRPSLKRGKYKQTKKPIYGCKVNGFIVKTVNEGLFVTTNRETFAPKLQTTLSRIMITQYKLKYRPMMQPAFRVYKIFAKHCIMKEIQKNSVERSKN